MLSVLMTMMMVVVLTSETSSVQDGQPERLRPRGRDRVQRSKKQNADNKCAIKSTTTAIERPRNSQPLTSSQLATVSIHVPVGRGDIMSSSIHEHLHIMFEKRE